MNADLQLVRNIIILEDYALIRLTQGKFAKIDLDDVFDCQRYNWSLTIQEYAISGEMKLLLHRFIMDCPPSLVVDHINHDTLDNRKQNLRIVTHSQNHMNRKKKFGKNGYYGIYPQNGGWIAQIWNPIEDKRQHLGTFKTKQDAANARYLKVCEYYGEEFAAEPYIDESSSELPEE